LLIKLRHKN